MCQAVRQTCGSLSSTFKHSHIGKFKVHSGGFNLALVFKTLISVEMYTVRTMHTHIYSAYKDDMAGIC